MKVRALVVDDSRVMRNMVMEALRKSKLADFEFTEAQDGADGMSKYDPAGIDIIVVDWNMPKMSGIDFARQVRAMRTGNHVPIVMVTSESTMGKIEQALEQARVNAYITKPFTLEDLHRKVAKLVTDAAKAREAAQAAPAAPAAAPKSSGGGFFSKLIGG